MIAAPLFHSWGFAHFMLGLSLGLDLRCCAASFDPEETLRATRRAPARRRSSSCR